MGFDTKVGGFSTSVCMDVELAHRAYCLTVFTSGLPSDVSFLIFNRMRRTNLAVLVQRLVAFLKENNFFLRVF